NGVAERRNKTLIEAARTMLADAKLPVTFWAEAVNTACYVQKKVLVTKPHNKTPCTKEDVHQAVKEKVSPLGFITLPNWFHEAQMETSNEVAKKDDAIPDNNSPQKEQQEVNRDKEVRESSQNSNPTGSSKVSTNDSFELASSTKVETKVPIVSSHVPTDNLFVPPNRLEDFFGDTSNAVSLNEVEADLSNMETAIQVSPTPTLRIHKDHLKSQIIGPVDTLVQTRQKTKDEKGIDYEEVFAPVARIEAIRLFLAYDSYMGFTIYQMDVKNAFLYGTIDEEYLLDNGFQRGTIDHTLFFRKHKGEFLLVQLYVDDIIIGSSNPKLCREFEALMHDKFQISAMGELNFFLGLQVLQKKDGIFLSQDKYVGDILKKFGYTDIRAAKTPMDRENPWGKDETGKVVELHLYRSMIGSLMYLTASRPDIMFAVCACARQQVTPKECHLHAVKRSFRYLKGNPKLGLWYPKESPFDLVEYSYSDYGGANQDRKSALEVVSFWEKEKTKYNTDFHQIVDFLEASHIRVETTDGETKILAHVNGRQRTISESSIRRHLKLNDEEGPVFTSVEVSHSYHYAVSKSKRGTIRISQSKVPSPRANETAFPIGDVRYGKAFPTDASLIAGQERENIAKTSVMPHEALPRVTSLGVSKGTKASGTEPTHEQQSEEPKELSEEELKKMIELVPVEELYIEALQSLVKETCSTTDVIDERENELWVELKRLYELDSRDPLWALQRQSVPTADVYIAKKLATVEDFTLLHEDKIYSESKTRVWYI
nr:hypothetical protein [Tanacetum cinerariifolium]